MGVGMALAACGSGSAASTENVNDHAQLLRAEVTTVKPATGVRSTALADGMRKLGYELAEHLQKTTDDGNLVFSPTSPAVAFAMVREGATGAAARQIDKTVGLPHNRSKDFNALLGSLARPGSGNVLDVGDALFTRRGYSVETGFLDALKKWYGAGVYQTTFPDEGTAAVNAYVDQHTHGLVPDLVTDQFTSDTVMSLVNTLYLDARWLHPFDLALTSPQKFTTRSGSIDVKTMVLSRDDVDYAAGGAWQAVRLPYRGDRLSMEVLVPRAGTSPVDLLAPRLLTQAESRFTSVHVDLSLPRWSFATDASLKPILISMGMRAPFAPGGFAGITPDPTFELDSVIQQARIEVGEKGTVAAAATEVEGMAGGEQIGGEVVDADHPFAYVVLDNTTGVPVFEGTVGDPAQ